MSSKISQNAGQISAKADSSTVEALGTRVTTAEFNIDASAGTISQIVSNIGSNGEVTEASIVLAVNRASNKSSITLNASQIYLEGNTVAQKITGVEAQIGNIKNGSTICNQLTTQSIKVNGSYHHNSQITIDGVTYNIVTWGGSY